MHLDFSATTVSVVTVLHYTHYTINDDNGSVNATDVYLGTPSIGTGLYTLHTTYLSVCQLHSSSLVDILAFNCQNRALPRRVHGSTVIANFEVSFCVYS